MILLTPVQAFNVFYKYILDNWELDNDVWEVRDILSEATTDLEIACHTGGPTNDPAVWEDWRIAVDEMQKGGILKEIFKGEQPCLNCEQALQVMNLFLEEQYWAKNCEISIRNVMTSISEALSQENFEATEVWKQWLKCVSKALEFKEIFDNAYFEKLEIMRRQYWENKKGKPWSEIIGKHDS